MAKLAASSVSAALKQSSTPKKAKASAWFFKTEKGHYGYGDVFYGVTVPEQRKIARRFKELPLTEIKKLLKSTVHECRLTALIILVEQFRRANEENRKNIFDFYLKNRNRVNNWDLVDSSAGYIVGGYLLDKPKTILTKLAHSESLWDKRIAMIATHRFIYEDQFADTFKIAQLFLKDKHDLIHKAVGWMLREVGNRDQQAEEKFLKKYYRVMPRTMLRYAIEKFPKNKRAYYMKSA